MSYELNEEDRQAVDLLLDRTAESRSHDASFAKPADEGRVAAAASVLRLLDSLPAQDPSADLVRKTLSRIDQSFNTTPGAPATDPNQPHA